MPKKKTASTSSTSSVTEAPTVGAPKPPKGFVAPQGRILGAPATSQQERDADDVAREITTSKTYVKDFTTRAPAAADLAVQLRGAKAWSDEVHAAEAWLKYVQVQRALAWKTALATAKKLKREFDVSADHDPEVSTKYPQTKAFFGVWKVAAARAAVTRASKKKANGKANGTPKPEGK